MIRDVFLPLLGSNADGAALDSAVALAVTHGAHVTVLVTALHPLPLVADFAYVPLDTDRRLIEEAQATAAATVAHARARLAREVVSSEVHCTEVMMLWSEMTASLLARHSDISVLAQPGADLRGPRFALAFESLLMQSGRPVLVVPEGAPLKLPLRRVVLAWKPTPEATRALHDALPLLAETTEVDVLMIEPDVGEYRHGQQPGADIATHLSRHGLKVNVVAIPKQGQDAGANLLRYMQETDGDLLVMGGYGHSRWREWVLGGTTCAVLDGAKKPVLFSH